MKSIFKPYPLLKETLESWAKIQEDIAKAAILAMPAVVLFGNYSVWHRCLMILGLLIVIICGAVLPNMLRSFAKQKE